MYKVNIYSFEISKNIMGAEAWGTENNIYGRNITNNFVRNSSVEKRAGQSML
jgi:hypothetical protein